jgi:hypothetical protein
MVHSSSRLSRRLLLAACAIVLCAVATESRAKDTAAFGRQGGGRFRAECGGPGDPLYGIDVQVANGVIVAIAPVCHDHNNPEITSTYGSPWAGQPKANQGPDFNLRCAPGSVVGILDVYVDGAFIVNNVGLSCFNPTTAQFNNVYPVTGAQTFSNKNVGCPGGMIGSGIYGRAGTAIDLLGLVCQPLSAMTAAGAPAPTPTPTPTPTPQAIIWRTVVNPQGTTIYDQAENGNDVDYLNPGDKVKIIDCPNGPENMCQISKPKAGWVYGGDLKKP